MYELKTTLHTQEKINQGKAHKKKNNFCRAPDQLVTLAPMIVKQLGGT
jgi:hypothetical protein